MALQAVISSGPGLGVQNVIIKLHHKQLTGPTAGLDDDTQYLVIFYKHLLASGWFLLLLATSLQFCHLIEVYASLLG